MFLNARGRYTRDGEQIATGPYLWVVHGPRTSWEEATAFVRTVTLHQSGHFMMGQIHVGGHYATLSGAYGSDGLPSDVPQHVYEAGIRIPADLLDAWNKGGGHNGPGSEATGIRDWAVSSLPALKRAGRSLPSNHRDRLAGVVLSTSYPHPVRAEIDRILGRIPEAAYQWPFERFSTYRHGRQEVFLDRVLTAAIETCGLTEAQIAAHPWRAAGRVLDSWRAIESAELHL